MPGIVEQEAANNNKSVSLTNDTLFKNIPL